MDFFELLGLKLLGLVEESRLKGQVSGALNATFVALTPKSDKPKSLNDFRPISLCSLIYNIIIKAISNRIKPIMSKFMSKHIA